MTTTQSNRRTAALLNTCWPAIVAACWFTGCGKPAATPEQTVSAAISQTSSPDDDPWVLQANARMQQDREAHEQWAKQDGANAWVLPDHIRNEPTAQATTNPIDPLVSPPAPALKANNDYLKDFETRPVGNDAKSEQPQSNSRSATPGDSVLPKASFDGSLRPSRESAWLIREDLRRDTAALDLRIPKLWGFAPFSFNELVASKLEIAHGINTLEARLAVDPNLPAVEIEPTAIIERPTAVIEIEPVAAIKSDHIQNFSFGSGAF